ncbi:MAG: D-alanyl-D-alanine carboxypeptidase [Lachnospiraceae bacterium]|nr:D-alanyl-D-alanine carboxypeptidase [Lachnospiraceae bacterium]
MLGSCLQVWAEPAEELIVSPHGVLMEATTGKILFEKDKDTKVSPASITKIMTLILIFDELEKGSIQLTDEVVTSAFAKSMGGSQVFLEEGEKQTVETMIKCIVIASGNDASVAMAEHIYGTEQDFVGRMNERAAGLGMSGTHFVDCCGLTDSVDHYTTAYDVALMSRELIVKYPQVLDYSSVWMEDITHVTQKGSKVFGLTNTNKLVRNYEGCLGLKTGSTSIAKYCVSAVATRNQVTLISVIMTAPDYKVRFADAASLLNKGFGMCQVYTDENPPKLPMIRVKGALKKETACVYDGVFHYVDTTQADLGQIQAALQVEEEVKAPVSKDDVAGHLVYTLDGEEIGRVEVRYATDCPRATYIEFLEDTANHLWLT